MNDKKIKKTIFIITHGRSGSTLLMNILNTNKNFCIRGENRNALLGIFKSWRNVKNAKNDFANTISTSPIMPWYGIDDINEYDYAKNLVASFVKHILHPPEEASIIGFKEVRYAKEFFISEEEWIEYIEFMNDFFSDVHFIFLFRDMQSTSRSGFYKGDLEGLKKIESCQKLMMRAHATLNIKSLQINYEEINKDLIFVSKLEDFLKVKFNKEDILKTLDIKHSYGPHLRKA